MSRLSRKARVRWALLILLVGLPLYIAAAVTLVDLFGRPDMVVELLIYVALGIIWALPFRAVFLGLGHAEADGSGKDAGEG